MCHWSNKNSISSFLPSGGDDNDVNNVAAALPAVTGGLLEFEEGSHFGNWVRLAWAGRQLEEWRIIAVDYFA